MKSWCTLTPSGEKRAHSLQLWNGVVGAVQRGQLGAMSVTVEDEALTVLAYLTNGFRLAQGAPVGDLQDHFAAMTAKASRTGASSGIAPELWLVLYGEHCRARQAGPGEADGALFSAVQAAPRGEARRRSRLKRSGLERPGRSRPHSARARSAEE